MRTRKKSVLTVAELDSMNKLAKQCRGDILTMTTLAGSGHPGGSMSSIEIFLTVYMYAGVSREDYLDQSRDRVIISHGHTSPGVYATLGRLGLVDIEEVVSGFRHPGTVFEGHITRGIPGVEWTTGNLGQGLSAGVGMALGAKISGKNNHVYVVMGDAEQAKGQISEARRTAVKLKLNNITAIIDYNDAQISGKASEIMPVNIRKEYEASGWRVIEVDGHSIEELWAALNTAERGLPTVIIGHTTIGKGVSFMENNVKYHGVTLTEEQYPNAMRELGLEQRLDYYKKKRNQLTSQHARPTVCNHSSNVSEGVSRTYSDKTDNRTAAGRAIADLVEANPDSPFAAVDCDLLGSVKLDFLANKRPEKIIELGVQEHNAATIAGALSTCGVITFFADFGMFGIDEVYNQQRLNAINGTNVKVLCTHVGVDVGEDGKTHHCIDYIGALNNIFGWKLIVPGDPNQTDRAVRYAAARSGNFLVALGRSKVPLITDDSGNPFYGEGYSFSYGQVDLIREGSDATVITCGQLLHRAVSLSDELRSRGISVGVVNVSCPIEPDPETLLFLTEGKRVVVYEDHNSRTGLAAVFSRMCMEKARYPSEFIALGVADYALSGPTELILESSRISRKDLEKAITALCS